MALRFLTDEDYNNNILAGLLRKRPTLDIVRVQDVGLYQAPDPVILEWAAREGRVLLSHDKKTMQYHAYARIAASLPMPGIVFARQNFPIGRAIEEILFMDEHSEEGEWEGQVIFLPL